MWPGRLLTLLACVPLAAHADPVTEPIPPGAQYSIELYDGGILGNAAVVGMGGATTAIAIGTAGTLFNASAPAVKPTTDTDRWNWDYHLDYLNGSLSTDYDNNGLTSDNGGTSVFTGGFGVRVGEWAGAITATRQAAPVEGTVMLPSGMAQLTAANTRYQFAFGRWIRRLDMAFGGAFDILRFSLGPDCTGVNCGDLFDVTGAGLEAGWTWAPRRESFRLGASLVSRVYGADVESTCDPMDCYGYILPQSIVSPWRVSVGGAYRFADSYWNQLVGGYFRDERSLTVAADVSVVGSSENSFGLEAFGQHLLQRSGRHPGVSVRGGVEYEWLPGRLRLRAGSYWEPARFEGVSGRVHGTAGIEVRVFQFGFLGRERRGRITLTTDIGTPVKSVTCTPGMRCPTYYNLGLSIGFWH